MKNKTLHNLKSKLHPRSLHRSRYDFDELIKTYPKLKLFVSENTYGDLSIDFFNPEAVKALNKALLQYHYNINFWDIPKHYLCPPIPGRADYIHYIADLLEDSSKNKNIRGLDIGTGANCIYPLLGHKIYDWQFIGSDIDKTAVDSTKAIVSKNKLQQFIEVRLQTAKNHKLQGILNPDEALTFVMCNPPFHASAEDAKKATLRKLKNLKGKPQQHAKLNFGGLHNELWCKGGEVRFVKDLIYESKHFAKQCQWFTSLVSKASSLKELQRHIKKVGNCDIRIIDMGQGQKTSRILAWRFR